MGVTIVLSIPVAWPNPRMFSAGTKSELYEQIATEIRQKLNPDMTVPVWWKLYKMAEKYDAKYWIWRVIEELNAGNEYHALWLVKQHHEVFNSVVLSKIRKKYGIWCV